MRNKKVYENKKYKSQLMYDEFFRIYNVLPKDSFRIRRVFFEKIKNGEYSTATLSRLLVGINWLINNINTKEYFVTYEYLGNKIPYMNVYVINEKYPIKEYKIIKEKVILVNDFTINHIKENEQK